MKATHGQQWMIEVSVDERLRSYRVRTITAEAVPWRDWAGDSAGKRPLIDGDSPVTSAFKRMQARKFPRIVK